VCLNFEQAPLAISKIVTCAKENSYQLFAALFCKAALLLMTRKQPAQT
jgi:hypothetical protein